MDECPGRGLPELGGGEARCGSHHGLRDGDVIGVPIEASRADDGVGSPEQSPDPTCNLPDRSCAPMIGDSEPDHFDPDEAESRERLCSLLDSSPTKLFTTDSGRRGVRCLAVRDGHDDDLASLRTDPAHEPARGEHLVVGVGCDHDDAISTGR